jgi:hypothetical protein
MEVLKNLRVLNDLDDETAILVIQLALEELDNLLQAGKGKGKRSGGTSSAAEKALERTRDELQRHIRRIAARASKHRADGGGVTSSTVVRPLVSATGQGGTRVYDRPITRPGPRLGEPSSSSTSSVRKKPYVCPTNEKLSSSASTKKPPETRPAPSQIKNRGTLDTTERLVYHTNGESSSSAVTKKPLGKVPAPSQNESREPSDTAEQRTCSVCMEDFIWFYVASLPCGHHYCSACLTEMFKGAMVDESRYPPRCCEPISVEEGLPFLHWKVMRDYLEKKVEWDTKDRTYCSNKECLTFIRPKNIRKKKAKCPKCGTKTCSKCKKAAHNKNEPCLEDQELQQTLTLIERNHWQRCKHCGAGIERTFGCNEIQ